MRFTTTKPLSVWFAKIDVAEKFDKPCLLVAGSGNEPDYSQLKLTDFAQKDEWRATIQDLAATAARMRVPYVEPDPNAPRNDDVPPLKIETNPVIPIAVGTQVAAEVPPPAAATAEGDAKAYDIGEL